MIFKLFIYGVFLCLFIMHSPPVIRASAEDSKKIRDLLDSESQISAEPNFLSPVIPWDKYADNPSSQGINTLEEYLNKYSDASYSAFIVQYKNKKFLLTAGHVARYLLNEKNTNYVNWLGKWITVKGEFRISNNIDLAAIDVTEISHFADVGHLKLETADLKKKETEIFVYCNPLSLNGMRIGIFRDFEELMSFKHIAAEFFGIGVVNGCSGSPVVGRKNQVLGLIVRSGSSGKDGYAVPSYVIALFLDAKFFQ